MQFVFFLATLLSMTLAAAGNAQDQIWTWIGNEVSHLVITQSHHETPIHYSLFAFNEDAFKQSFSLVPLPDPHRRLPIPTPEGYLEEFVYWDSQVMDSELAADNPDISTLQGYNAQIEQLTIRFDSSPQGFHAQGYSVNGLYYISPLHGNIYIVFYAQNYRPLFSFGCDHEDNPIQEDFFEKAPVLPLINYGTTKRTYRLAVSATGEYTMAVGGTVASALSSIVTAVNFINGIYEREVAVKLQLIANNSNIIYTNPLLDPFTPELGNSQLLTQNQVNTDLVIGSANYDIGHLVHNLTGTGNSGSGVATLSSTCRALYKARGVSTSSRVGANPINPFFYRVLAHEIGHQFAAHHSFNASCNNNRTNSTAYEPGSGSTIMSYAGGCSPYNVQTLADTYFHRISLEEIAAFLQGTGATCGVLTNTGNAIPSAEAGLSYTIPRSTPFVLTGVGSDINGNVLTYDWEQYNNEIAVMPPSPTSTVGPNFRSFPPTTSPQRYFPRLADILANTSPTWEVLSSVARTMTFSLVVRDGVGGASSDNTTVTVSGTSGPFVVLSPNGGETRRGTIVVSWNRANTHLAPVSTTLVDILLSTNNGSSFTTVLANNTPNDGSQTVTLPSISTTQARIQVRAEGNIFFDVSNGPFTITP